MIETLKTVWDHTLFTLSNGSEVQVKQLVLVFGVLLLGYLLSKVVERLIRQRLSKLDVRPDASHMLQRIVFYTLIAGVTFTALSLLNVPLGAFAFISGAVAIGVGFGAQNVINNFISGWILLIEKPVRLEDFIEIDDHVGVVEHIGNRSTRIRRTDGVHLLIPNSQMLERVVVNWTLIDYDIRTEVSVGVAYGSPTRLTAELILQAVNEQSGAQDKPKPAVFFEDFADSALLFQTLFWCKVGGERELRAMRSEIRFRIDELFTENGIVIAFPQRDLHIDTTSPLEIKLTRNTDQ